MSYEITQTADRIVGKIGGQTEIIVSRYGEEGWAVGYQSSFDTQIDRALVQADLFVEVLQRAVTARDGGA